MSFVYYDRIMDMLKIIDDYRCITSNGIKFIIEKDNVDSYIISSSYEPVPRFLKDGPVNQIIKLVKDLKLVTKSQRKCLISVNSGKMKGLYGKYPKRVVDLFEVVQGHKNIPKRNLVRFVKTGNISSFVVSPPGVVPVKVLSDTSIYRTIKLLMETHLVHEGRQECLCLTPAVSNAFGSGKIHTCMERKIRSYVSGSGAKLAVIKKTIAGIAKPCFSDSITIYNKIGAIKISKERFGILLNLLAEIGVIKVHPGRIFYF